MGCVFHLKFQKILTLENIALPGTIKEASASMKAFGVPVLLSQYQSLLLHIMKDSDIPGVSSRELEAFRNEFCKSVHTCRLRTCPRATIGFETRDLRIQHEVSHVRRYPCTQTGCQYPPFLSSRSLQQHIRKEHDTDKPPRSIRRVNNAATILRNSKENGGATLTEQQMELTLLEQKAKTRLMRQMQQNEGSRDINKVPPGANESHSASDFTHNPALDLTPHILSVRDSEHAVQEYHMQAILLQEQKKKRRLMMSRQETAVREEQDKLPVASTFTGSFTPVLGD